MQTKDTAGSGNAVPRNVILDNVRDWRIKHGLVAKPANRRGFNRDFNRIGRHMQLGGAK